VHPRFKLLPAFYHPHRGQQRAVHYEADFEYYEQGVHVVEDVKGVRTRDYVIKRKMLLYQRAEIDFREVKA